MNKNLALLPKEEMEKISVDLAAAGVAFKERYRMPVAPEMIECKQPIYLRSWFRKRLTIYRLKSTKLPCLPYKLKMK